MSRDQRITEKLLPVLVGPDYEHVLGRAWIDQRAEAPEEGRAAEVKITITATGEAAQLLGDFLAAAEPVALSFVAIPVTPHTRQTEKG